MYQVQCINGLSRKSRGVTILYYQKMKVLKPAITVLLMAHMKPTLEDSLVSLYNQTRLNDVQILLLDSGKWLGKDDEISKKLADTYNSFHKMPNLDWFFTGEPDNSKELYCPVAYWTNRVLDQGLIRGTYFCTFYDDDIYYPQFLEKMSGYMDAHPTCNATWCSEQWEIVGKDGTETKVRVLEANRILTTEDQFDNAVDGMQVMMRTSVIMENNIRFDEDTENCRHSDGVFLEKFIKHAKEIHNVSEILCKHRFTPHSTYTPSA